MKKISKSLLALLISVLVIVPVTLTGCEKEESYPKNEVAMWEVTSDDSDATLYLMGSIHAAKPDTFPLREKITNAFEESDYLAVEANVNEFAKDVDAQVKVQNMQFYDDGTKITDHLSKSTYEKAKLYFSELNLYTEQLDFCRPGAWDISIDQIAVSQSKLNYSEGVDTTLIEMAEEKGKEILEVESIEFQMDMIMNFPDEFYDISIREKIDAIGEYDEDLEELYDTWHTGDIEKIAEEDDFEDLTEEEQKLVDDYNKVMLTDRNIGMADKAEQYLAEDKDVFYVVGFAHMVGDDGIVELLKDRGYTVTRV